jgi:3',5'-cyclic AMP phosphodiesterase CpdA
MKIILLTDTHLTAPGGTVCGLDPLARLDACIADINRHHADADLVVLSGDLANDGEPEAYMALRESLTALTPPHHLMLGNHDDRAIFRDVFPEADVEDGFVQAAVDTADGRLILLDTLDFGHVEGRLCAERLRWLDRRLGEAQGRPVFVFMHHPPFQLRMPVLDGIGLADPDLLHAVMAKHGNVRHIFAGHVHRLATGVWRGIPFSTLRGTNHQAALVFTALSPPASFEPPIYAIAFLDGEVVVHFHEFLERSTQPC